MRMITFKSMQNFCTFKHIAKTFGLNPNQLSGSQPFKAHNYVNGNWKESQHYKHIIDPLNGDKFIQVPDTQAERELIEFKSSIETCPKSGLHNPLKNPDRYVHYGTVSNRIANQLAHPDIEDFFIRLIQRVTPKSYESAKSEVNVTQKFFENFSGDQVRFMFKSFNVSGNHYGQESKGYRWPYGPVAIVAPFNFPLEIPALQFFGALMAGNKVLLKPDQKVSVVMECLLKLALECGLPQKDVDMMHADGPATSQLFQMSKLRLVQFTGSSQVAEKLSETLNGKVRIEDAGFNWKVLGPDVQDFDSVAHTCDHDAYSFSGQKCSAQSILFTHSNWVKKGLWDEMKRLASQRNLNDLTIGPVLTWSNEKIQNHIDSILQANGAKVLFGGKPLDSKTHKIPACYGSFEPTAIYVPLKEIAGPKNFDKVTKELFGPFQVVTDYDDSSLELVLDVLERIPHNLTAAIVSNDIRFINHVASNTVNGVTYVGSRARTTGAPQNHWFGPCGDPRGAGIGTTEAIIQTWTSHREIIFDVGPLPKDWSVPKQV